MIDKVCFWAAILLFIIGTVAIFLMGHFNRAPDLPFPGQNKKYVPSSTETFWSSMTLPSVSRPHEPIEMSRSHSNLNTRNLMTAQTSYILSHVQQCVYYDACSTIINDSQDTSAVLRRLAECFYLWPIFYRLSQQSSVHRVKKVWRCFHASITSYVKL